MDDFSNASFPPETIDLMKTAMDAAVATLPEPVSSAHVQSIARRPSCAPPRLASATPSRCKEWPFWSFRSGLGLDGAMRGKDRGSGKFRRGRQLSDATRDIRGSPLECLASCHVRHGARCRVRPWIDFPVDAPQTVIAMRLIDFRPRFPSAETAKPLGETCLERDHRSPTFEDSTAIRHSPPVPIAPCEGPSVSTAACCG